MRPSVPAMVKVAQVELAREMLSAPPEKLRFLIGIKMILEVVSRDWNTAVRDKVAEIRELRELLGRGSALSPALSAALREASAGAAVSLELSLPELEAMQDGLVEVAIELQAWLEENVSPEGVKLTGDLGAHFLRNNQRQALADVFPW